MKAAMLMNSAAQVILRDQEGAEGSDVVGVQSDGDVAPAAVKLT